MFFLFTLPSMRRSTDDYGFAAILVIVWLAIIAAILILFINLRKPEPKLTFPTSTTESSTTAKTPKSLPELADLSFREDAHGAEEIIYKGVDPCSKHEGRQHFGTYIVDKHEVAICTDALNEVRSRIYAYKLIDGSAGEEYISGFLTLKQSAQPEAYLNLYGGYFSMSGCQPKDIPALESRRIADSRSYSFSVNDTCAVGHSMQFGPEKTLYYKVNEDLLLLFDGFQGSNLPLIGG